MSVVIVYRDLQEAPRPLEEGMWISSAPRPDLGISVGMNEPVGEQMVVFEPPPVRPDLYTEEILSQCKNVWAMPHGAFANTKSDAFHPISLGLPPLWPEPKPSFKSWRERENAVAVFYTGKRSSHIGEQYSRRDEVITRLLNNGISVLQLQGIPFGQAKIEALSNFRYHLCAENFVSPHYHTEKLIDCVAAGCIPISNQIYPVEGIKFISTDALYEITEGSDEKWESIQHYNWTRLQPALTKLKTALVWQQILSTLRSGGSGAE
jgi:hypothetical protein